MNTSRDLCLEYRVYSIGHCVKLFSYITCNGERKLKDHLLLYHNCVALVFHDNDFCSYRLPIYDDHYLSILRGNRDLALISELFQWVHNELYNQPAVLIQ